jgi:hypothetical protein
MNMETRNFNPTVIEEGLGALLIGACIAFRPLLRPWYSRWGAADDEVEKPLPGDDHVPQPNLQTTRAITIQAPIEAVWPWVVQMGQGRGGLYSYERLENLAGCQMVNADRILPEHQDLKAGDKFRIMVEGSGPAFDVLAVEPGQALILGGDEPPTSWGFILEAIDERSTRLYARFRQNFEPTFGNTLMWRVFTEPISFVMGRKMLQGIKVRAEANC